MDVESDSEYIGLHEFFSVDHAAFVKNANHGSNSSFDQLWIAMSECGNDSKT